MDIILFFISFKLEFFTSCVVVGGRTGNTDGNGKWEVVSAFFILSFFIEL